MPKYKLSYLNARGRGELIRLILTVAGQDFEDHSFGSRNGQKSRKIDLARVIEGEHLPRFLNMFSMYLNDSGGDVTFFVGNSGTIADLAVHDILTTFLQINDKLLDSYPELQINRTATEALPNLDTYLAERPKCEL